jgi:hypothetical protein
VLSYLFSLHCASLVSIRPGCGSRSLSIIRRPLVEPAVYDLASPSSRERTGFISFGALMNFPVTFAIESDQALLGRSPGFSFRALR